MEAAITFVKEGPSVPYPLMYKTFYKPSQIYKWGEEFFLSLLEKPEEKYLEKKWLIPLGKTPEVPKEVLEKYFPQVQEESSPGNFLKGAAERLKKAAEFRIGDNHQGKKVEHLYYGLVGDYFEDMRGLENRLALRNYELLKSPSIMGTAFSVDPDSPVHVVVTETYHSRTTFEFVFMRWLTINIDDDEGFEQTNPVFVRVIYNGEEPPIDAKIMIEELPLKTMSHFQKSQEGGEKSKKIFEKVEMFLKEP